MKSLMKPACLTLCVTLFLSARCLAEGWPGWMGDDRDGVYSESGVVDAIPAEGLPVKWTTAIAGGYAGPAVAGGKVFVFDYEKSSGEIINDPGTRAVLTGKERLIALDAASGQPIWKHEYDCPYSISYPAGPRCTPTVDGDRVYTLGSEGDLHCVDVESGNPIWTRSFKNDFSAEVPIWGFSSHPLVDGDLLYCMVGGTGQGVVAFDKMTGEVKWKALDAKAGYCPTSIIQAGGVPQLIVFHPEGVVGMNPTDGSVYWNIDVAPMYEMSISRPMVDGDLMYASGIGSESVMIRLDSDRPAAEELWRGERDSALYTSNSTPLFVDGVVYGTDCHDGSLIAMDAKTGNRLWETYQATAPDRQRKVDVKHGTAFLTRLGDSDRYLLFAETGHLIIASLTAEGYQEHGRFRAIAPTSDVFGRDVVWSHPAYANRTAYLRNDQQIVAVDLAR